MKTKEQIREAKRIKQAKYYANRSPEQKAKENEKARLYSAKRRELNKDKIKEKMAIKNFELSVFSGFRRMMKDEYR